MQKNKQKIIIDTDPGVDDAIALFMALAENSLDIIGITTVAGNVPLKTSFDNARGICSFCNRNDITVYAGCERPLERDFVDAVWVHGEGGIGGVQMPEAKGPIGDKHAVDFIIDSVADNDEGSIVLVTLAPLTNIASAILKAPKTMKKVSKIIGMCGAFDETGGRRGNTTPYAEYNIYADPHAAEVVFTSGINVVTVPMETGLKAVADREFIKRLYNLNNRIAFASAKMLESVMARMKTEATPLYDPCAVGFLVRTYLFDVERGTIETITDDTNEKFGMTKFVKGQGDCLNACNIDKKGFLDYLYGCIKSY